MLALIPNGPHAKPWRATRVARLLFVISTAYLALPHLIFYAGWLRWPLALLAGASLCIAVGVVARTVARTPERSTTPTDPLLTELQGDGAQVDNAEVIFTRQDALMIGAVCLIWLVLAGVGGLVSQDLDWNKHNMVLNSLMHKPWPTVYEIYKVDVPLVYYIAYYLPAALVGKVGGWLWLNGALLAWSLIGLVIAVLWFCILVRRCDYATLGIFIFFSGLDVIGKALANFGVWNIVIKDWQHIDSWASIWQYSSNATLLNWVPPQALGGWVVMGMTLYCLTRWPRREVVLLPFGLSALWTPFVTLGLLSYLLIDFLVAREPWGARTRRMVSMPNSVGVLVLAMTAFYYSAKASAGSPVVIQDFLSGLSITTYAGSRLDAVAFLLFFCLLEFGFYAIILYRAGAVQDEQWRWLLDITVLTLAILPWFKLGVYNDLVMRASIPALFVLAVLVARAVFDTSLARSARMVLVVVLMMGAITPGIEFKRHLQRMVELPAPIFDAAAQKWDFVYYMTRQTFFFGQYAGSLDAPFFQLAAKPIAADNGPVADSEEGELNRHDYLLYGKHIYLVRDAVTAAPEVAAGDTLTVTLPVHFFGPLNLQPYDPVLRLTDAAGEVVATGDAWAKPLPEISPFWMTKWSGQVTTTVPSTATLGIYHIEVGFTGREDGELLTAHTVPEDDTIGAVVTVASTRVIRDE